MNMPLITDEKDPKWVLLGKILGIVSSRRVKQEMAKQGISPMNLAGTMFKKIPEAKDIYRFLARFGEKQFIELVLGVFGSICVKRGRVRVEQYFTWDRTAKCTIDVYEEIIRECKV